MTSWKNNKVLTDSIKEEPFFIKSIFDHIKEFEQDKHLLSFMPKDINHDSFLLEVARTEARLAPMIWIWKLNKAATDKYPKLKIT